MKNRSFFFNGFIILTKEKSQLINLFVVPILFSLQQGLDRVMSYLRRHSAGVISSVKEDTPSVCLTSLVLHWVADATCDLQVVFACGHSSTSPSLRTSRSMVTGKLMRYFT